MLQDFAHRIQHTSGDTTTNRAVTAQCPASAAHTEAGTDETGGTDTQTDMVPNKRDRHMRSKI